MDRWAKEKTLGMNNGHPREIVHVFFFESFFKISEIREGITYKIKDSQSGDVSMYGRTYVSKYF